MRRAEEQQQEVDDDDDDDKMPGLIVAPRAPQQQQQKPSTPSSSHLPSRSSEGVSAPRMTPTTSPSFFSTLIPDWEDEDDYPDIPNPTGAALNHVNDDDDNHSDDSELLSDLEPRERDDDDSSDPDMPSLLARDEMDSDCDSDNSPPEPPPRQNNNQGRNASNANNANRPAPRRNQRVAPAERSDHDSSSDGLPELIPRIPVAPRSRGNDSSSDSSIPGLVTASNKASEPIVSNRGSEPASRLARRTARNKEETMKKEQPIKQMQEKATSRQAIRASRINEEKKDGLVVGVIRGALTPSELRDGKCEDDGVDGFCCGCGARGATIRPGILSSSSSSSSTFTFIRDVAGWDGDVTADASAEGGWDSADVLVA